uniref:Uncharacterized protein n=1 Tax=Salmo trutta TaxID=8032 RepID=A0A674C3G1_SALTR
MALGKQQAHTAVGQHTLLHGEALLVIASADAHHGISSHLCGHTLLIKGSQLPVAGNEIFRKQYGETSELSST